MTPQREGIGDGLHREGVLHHARQRDEVRRVPHGDEQVVVGDAALHGRPMVADVDHALFGVHGVDLGLMKVDAGEQAAQRLHDVRRLDVPRHRLG